MNVTTSIGDKQVAQVIQRGSAIVLSLMQEETVDEEVGVIYPAKSFTIHQLDGLKNLRDLLIQAIPLEEMK